MKGLPSRSGPPRSTKFRQLRLELHRALEKIASKRFVSGAPFDEDQFVESEAMLQRALTDAGYAYARVTRDATVDLVHRTADIVMRVEPGAPAVFGAVTIEGLDGLPEGPGSARPGYRRRARRIRPTAWKRLGWPRSISASSRRSR